MRKAVLLYCVVVLLAMTALTVTASLDRGVFTALGQLWPDAWFLATLADAYFAFLFVWIWVAWRERSWPARLGWLVAFLLLGNFAIAAYVILRLARSGRGAPMEKILLPEAAP